MFKCLAGDENLPSTGLINSNYSEKELNFISVPLSVVLPNLDLYV